MSPVEALLVIRTLIEESNLETDNPRVLRLLLESASEAARKGLEGAERIPGGYPKGTRRRAL